MATAATNDPIAADRFRETYPELKPLLLQEYPQIDAQTLDANNSDPEKLINFIAKKTDHTRTKVRRDIDELSQIVRANGEGRLRRAMHVLEERSQELATRFQEEIVPKAEQQMREYLWTSVFSALGVGVVIGLLFGLTRGR